MGEEADEALKGGEPERWTSRDDAATPEARAGALLRLAPPVPPLDDARIERMRHRVRLNGGRKRPRARWLALGAVMLGGVAVASLALRREPDEQRTAVTVENETPAPVRPARVRPPQVLPPLAPQPRMVTELALLGALPPDLLHKMNTHLPDEEGFAIGNRRGLFCSGNQRLAMDLVVVGAARSDRALVDQGFRAVDRTFGYQTENGNFGDDALCVGYWLSHLSHAMLVLEESALRSEYAPRLEALKPKVARAVEWLSQPERRAELKRHSRTQPGRCFQFANALGLSGLWLGDAAARAHGREFAMRGLGFQREDGSFDMTPAVGPAYHGSIMWQLARYALRHPDPDLDEAWRRAGSWLVARVAPDGVIDLTGNAHRFSGKGADSQRYDFHSAGWALLYYGARFDASAVEQARTVLRKRRVITR